MTKISRFLIEDGSGDPPCLFADGDNIDLAVEDCKPFIAGVLRQLVDLGEGQITVVFSRKYLSDQEISEAHDAQ